MLAGLKDLRASEDPQDRALVSLVEGFTAAARRQPQAALGHARAIVEHAGALGISHELLRWAWPLAARAAHDLRDTAAVGELLTLLDDYQPGHLAPMLRAERDLVRARLAAGDGDPAAAAAFASGGRERPDRRFAHRLPLRSVTAVLLPSHGGKALCAGTTLGTAAGRP